MTSMRNMLMGSVFAAMLFASVAIASAAEPSDATAISSFASPTDPPAFDTPEQAIDAFKAALTADDFNTFAALLGLDPAKTKTGEGVMDTYAEIRDGAKTKDRRAGCRRAEDHRDR